jgi:pantoate--beta-alanine ligase
MFVPSDKEMYPGGKAGSFSTLVVEQTLSIGMEGASRPGHFRGVTTVVAKLFNVVQPEFAVFGAKDYQQAAVLRRMTRDLNFPVKIVVAPTWREADGLAMSSRNKYLAGDLRVKALMLRRSIRTVQLIVRQSRGAMAADRMKQEVKRLFAGKRDMKLDYVEFFDPVTLKPEAKVRRGVHMALAAFIGKTRLIDNARL